MFRSAYDKPCVIRYTDVIHWEFNEPHKVTSEAPRYVMWKKNLFPNFRIIKVVVHVY